MQLSKSCSKYLPSQLTSRRPLLVSYLLLLLRCSPIEHANLHTYRINIHDLAEQISSALNTTKLTIQLSAMLQPASASCSTKKRGKKKQTPRNDLLSSATSEWEGIKHRSQRQKPPKSKITGRTITQTTLEQLAFPNEHQPHRRLQASRVQFVHSFV